MPLRVELATLCVIGETLSKRPGALQPGWAAGIGDSQVSDKEFTVHPHKKSHFVPIGCPFLYTDTFSSFDNRKCSLWHMQQTVRMVKGTKRMAM